MDNTLIATAQTTIDVPVDKVWNALVNPEIISKYMFGTSVTSEWEVGSDIFWKGNWKGKDYEDKGKIMQLEPNQVLSYTHFSPLAGKPDIPENYHTVTITLLDHGNKTGVNLKQDNNNTEEEKSHSEKNWAQMLGEMKKLLE